MRILIINDMKVAGGAELQSRREFDLFTAKGHDVYLLTFDGNYPYQLEGHQINIPLRRSSVAKALYRVKKSPEDDRIRELIGRIAPDVVHINNAYDASASLYDIVEGYPTIQTVRDYSIVCPKATCVDRLNQPCEGYSLRKCLSCSFPNIEFLVRTLIHEPYNKNRIRAVDKLVAPSGALARLATKNGFSVEELNNPFDFRNIIEAPKEFSSRHLFFAYGRISEEKGFDPLLDAWRSFARKHGEENVQLLLAGKVAETYEKHFNDLVRVTPSVKYLGILKYEEVMELYPKLYCVVVPSLWMENYPNTVLEALANKTLVVGSRRGGIPEMIGDEKFVFEPTSVHEIVDVLDSAENMKPCEYESVVLANYSRVKYNNSMELYYERLMSAYAAILGKERRA